MRGQTTAFALLFTVGAVPFALAQVVPGLPAPVALDAGSVPVALDAGSVQAALDAGSVQAALDAGPAPVAVEAGPVLVALDAGSAPVATGPVVAPPATVEPPMPPAAVAAPPEGSPTPAGERTDEASKPGRLHLSLEYTLGFGKVDVVDEKPLSSLAMRPQYVLTQAQVSASTFIAGGSFDVTPAFAAGMRVPFSYGALGNLSGAGSRAIVFGNLELFATLTKRLSPSLELAGALAVGLPTSLGTELPRTQAELSAYPVDTFDRAEANKFALSQATAAMFGYEQDQLFWSKRFALTPSLEARWSSGKVHLEPFVKLPNLIDTHGQSVEPYRLEVVFGASGGVKVAPWLDLGLRAWGAAAIARREASPIGAGVLSPQVRFLLGEHGDGAITVAAVLPFVGSNVDPWYFGALRLGISGRL